jgi:hypothetical protein
LRVFVFVKRNEASRQYGTELMKNLALCR